MDDGADLVGILHSERKELLADVIGGTEETTTGVIRLRSMAEKGSFSTRSWRSTMRTPNTFSITVTGRAKARWTG